MIENQGSLFTRSLLEIICMKCLLSIEISFFFFLHVTKWTKHIYCCTQFRNYSILNTPPNTLIPDDSTKQVLPAVLQMRNQYHRTFLILDLSSLHIVKKEEIYTVKITSSNSIFQNIFWVFHDGLDIFPAACFCRKDVERCFDSFSL